MTFVSQIDDFGTQRLWHNDAVSSQHDITVLIFELVIDSEWGVCWCRIDE